VDKGSYWDNAYIKKGVGGVSWYQDSPDYSLRLIKACRLKSDAALIDVGGGASRLVDHLLAMGFTNLSVLDISSEALSQARSRLEADAERVAWLEADITTFDPPQSYALWHDRAVFHFLTDAEDRRRYLSVVKAALQPEANLIIATFAPDGPDRCSDLPIEKYDAEKMVATLGNGFDLQETLSEQHVRPDGRLQHFNYCRFKRV